MRTAIPFALLATTLACSLFAMPVQARPRVFVASYGTDSGNCSFSAPCRNLPYAQTVVDTGGEITMIDSAGYLGLTITKSLTITSPPGVEASVTAPAGGPAISINTTGDVFLRGLTLEGDGSGTDGITLTAADTLGIVHCVIRHFTLDGIYLHPTGVLQLSILDTIASNNGNNGFDLSPSGSSGSIQGVIDHSTATSNGTNGITVFGSDSPDAKFLELTTINSVFSTNGANGIKVHGTFGAMPVQVMVRDTTASSNNTGFLVEGGGLAVSLILAHSVATANSLSGADQESGGIYTFGDNHIFANHNDTIGTLTPVPFK